MARRGGSDIGRARAFYDAVLATLGLRLLRENGKAPDYGGSTLMFSVETPVDGRPASVGNGVHIAFAAEDRGAVDAFHLNPDSLREMKRDLSRWYDEAMSAASGPPPQPASLQTSGSESDPPR